MTRRLAVLCTFAITLAGSAAGQTTTLSSQQITLSNDAVSEDWSVRNSPTSRGRILFVGNDIVRMYDGASIQTVQAAVANEQVNNTVFMLGSGVSATSTIAGYRRANGYAQISTDAAPPIKINLNPEAVSIGSGCVFMVLQDGAGAHVYKLDPVTGNTTKLSNGTVALGALRVASSGCNKAVWSWMPTNSSPQDLQYWNGTTTTTIVSDELTKPVFAGDWIVYTKLVSGIQQVFAIDTAGSVTPVQLSTETDSSKHLTPITDGRHVAWYRSDLLGTNASLVLSGGQTFPTGPLTKISAEMPFQLDRGQLLWKTSSGALQYDDGQQTFLIDKSPATSLESPWLTDGYIAFLGTTPTGGGSKEVFRVAGSVPADANAPMPPLLVTATPAGVLFDSILGATSYNAYVALVPGVTRDNYASLSGGQKITGVTSGFDVSNVPLNTTYYVAITAVVGGIESPSSRVATSTFIGSLTWQAVGSLSNVAFHSVAADNGNPSYAFAGANGAVYRSTNGGTQWSAVLSAATSGASRVAALAASGQRVFANMMTQGDIWRSADRGANWTRVLDATGVRQFGSLAINPVNTDIVYAGDFNLAGMTPNDSTVIKSANGGTSWTHSPYAPLTSDMSAYSIAIDPVTPATLYAGSNGTPNIAKSTDSAASWTSAQIAGGGEVRSVAINPQNPNTLYASTRDKGVFKSLDGGGSWTAKNSGLAGVSATFSGGAEFNSILVDPTNPSLIHLGAGNGYWVSTDGAETWHAANDGFGGSPAWIYALALTPERRLIAATETGLYLLSFAAPPTVTNVSPSSGHTGGGTSVTITGSAFQTGATVTFGGAAATSVNVAGPATLNATTPPHSAGVVSVVVTNPDAQSGTLAGAFNYVSTPDVPSAVTATALSTTSVRVSWSGSPSAAFYQVFRRSTGNPAYALIASPAASPYDDPVSAGAAYAYRVRSVSSGAQTSGDSAADIATTILFTNEPLGAGVTIQASHLSQLRTAVSHVRALAGLSPSSFTDSASSSVPIRAVHLTELRVALDAALSELGIAPAAYTDASPAALPVKAMHTQEIRNRVK